MVRCSHLCDLFSALRQMWGKMEGEMVYSVASTATFIFFLMQYFPVTSLVRFHGCVKALVTRVSPWSRMYMPAGTPKVMIDQSAT